MGSCCDPNGLAGMFGTKRAETDARDYRRNGLDGDERNVVAFLVDRGIVGATLLEIGGGVGTMQLELLRAGAARARNVEISPHYEKSAAELAVERGVADRLDRVVADFAASASAIAPADAVIMHKVICCYPDMPALVEPAADHAQRWLVLTFPAERWWIRAGLRVVNAVQRILRTRFRLFFHEPREIQAIAERSGLRPVHTRRGLFWQMLVLERP